MTSFHVLTGELDAASQSLSSLAGSLYGSSDVGGYPDAMENAQLEDAMHAFLTRWSAMLDQTLSDLHTLADTVSNASGTYTSTDSTITGLF